ncbi:hypothetical protein CCP3SC15_1110004 [Gammaproteobacteria bacterium]
METQREYKQTRLKMINHIKAILAGAGLFAAIYGLAVLMLAM